MELGKLALLLVHDEVDIDLASISRIEVPGQKYSLKFTLAGFGLAPKRMKIIVAVGRGLDDDFRRVKIWHRLHQRCHLQRQVIPECGLRGMEELRRCRPSCRIATCDGNDVAAVDLVEDELLGI